MTLQPYREPLRVTLLRTGAIALGVGAALVWRWGGPLTPGFYGRWFVASLLALWPTLGGHFVELWYLNRLRPRLRSGRPAQSAARVGVWFVGGVMLALCMELSARALGLTPRLGSMSWPARASVGGIAFIGIELVVHLALQLGGRPSFYNGRG
ncbi:hypothetical protein [Humisphaera borealis]|uniref:Uncharacterized protein n=1 Tax=Humisphaera borealis TaxID=2807512 RepID=A0A7M2WV91_9BACT|nr:hypothetical protein [Humisphaera borealis]QOV89234.1 hypothetical protein IPV69_23975 [Humisphaera borealis]